MPAISNEEKLRVLKEHINYEMEEKPEIVAIRELRKMISWYTKNMPNSSEFRDKINRIENRKILEEEIESFFNA